MIQDQAEGKRDQIKGRAKKNAAGSINRITCVYPGLQTG
jgi:uncharacterized protein YjbJ (UPF0337 family)